VNRRELTPEVVQRLIVDPEPWLSCDDCFRLVDQYVESVLGGRTRDWPEMEAHLRGCAACAEEAATVLELATQDAVEPQSP
jgi:hypothetical protein